jgi:hypothetical protein
MDGEDGTLGPASTPIIIVHVATKLATKPEYDRIYIRGHWYQTTKHWRIVKAPVESDHCRVSFELRLPDSGPHGPRRPRLHPPIRKMDDFRELCALMLNTIPREAPDIAAQWSATKEKMLETAKEVERRQV